MVTRYAIVINGVVDNVCLWDGTGIWQPPEGAKLIPLDGATVNPGDTYDGTTFTATPRPLAPTVVPVEIDPKVITDLIATGSKATSVAGLRTAFVALAEHLLPTED